MSANANYRRDYVPRGGGNFNRGRGGGAGRGGGGFNKPRRYWDNDDFSYKDKRDDRNRRRHSRSRSRSRSSRSYSKSRSRSMSPRNSRRNDRPPIRHAVEVTNKPDNYEQYVPQAEKVMQSTNVDHWKPAAFSSEYGTQFQANGNTNKLSDDFQQQMLRTQQLQKYQLQQSMEDPSLTFGGYDYSSVPNSTLAPQQASVPHLYPQSEETIPLKQDLTAEVGIVKKKKEKRKKKKSRRRSSSSSSSSSDSSSEESRKKRKSKRGSDDSSLSSSEGDGKHQKEKPSETGGGGGSRLTDEQRQALLNQQDGYRKKLELLDREVSKLQTKEDELKRNRADKRLIEENLKLQAELKGRCTAVHVVLEKINTVLVGDKGVVVPVPPPPPKISEPNRPVEAKLTKKELADVDYIDNGQHWCRLCNVFPETVEQMLMHFHSSAHRDQVEQLGIDDKPWHKRNANPEHTPGASARKLPLRGMQFFSPVEGWYCRLCNVWMGDQHCASSHLKCLEHNINYMTFLEEHTDWETKWNNDREKARLRALGDGKTEPRKSRFENALGSGAVDIDDDGSGHPGSIRVQMRNTIKVEDPQGAGFASKFDAKDAGIDEWMGKPQKVALDIIDTQKFAEIVRQRHGAMKKEEVKSRDSAMEQLKPAPTVGNQKEKEGGREVDRRRFDRVEMQIPARDNRDIRDRYRDTRALRGGRRRSRSRSRSRSREKDRGFHGRRRSRSRSRDRDRRDRGDRNNRDRVDGSNRKMPMIGKMPLYKKGKDKADLEKEILPTPDEAANAVPFSEQTLEYSEEYMMSTYAEPTAAAQVSESTYVETVPASSTYPAHHVVNSTAYVSTAMVPATDVDLKPPGEKEAPGGTNLPDDLQHALDIIYRGGGKPITIPPPNFPTGVPPPGMPMGVPPPSMVGYGAPSSAYPAGYMGYEQSYFTSADMEEVSFAGNISEPAKVEEKVSEKADTEASNVISKADPEPENGGEDDLDDLRMLGIDVDDVAVVKK